MAERPGKPHNLRERLQDFASFGYTRRARARAAQTPLTETTGVATLSLGMSVGGETRSQQPTITVTGVDAEGRSIIDRHDPVLTETLVTAPVYKKQGEVRAQIAQGGEQVITRLADGTHETVNVAKEGDAIITNPGGEQYIIDAGKFGKRYEPKVDEPGVYTAKGFCRAVQNPLGQSVSLMASWGEMQNGAADAMLADTYDPETRQLGGEPYIIGRAEFQQTYKPADQKFQIPATPKTPQGK